ncbi:MAG: haloacid dehalogenase type II [Alphaproteobacteria bacterium]|nr:haloacid dehalogenase type II [Alphaproteobacteria bacterium]MDX5368294.1 haloacid dehalogenase type II [Alphaproteobacteria bacterium]MDX5463100.1 haloacid dehalogenase type II [Alphaproteobacteria bacterium]
MVQALFFDVFGTVVDWRTSIVRELAAFGARQGAGADWETMADHWRGLYQPAMERIRSGSRGYVKLDTLHRENLDATLDAYGISDVTEGVRDDLSRAWHRLDPWPDSVPGLARLRTRYLLAPVSNGNISLMVHLARHGNLPWDTVLGSEIAHDYKPKPAVYLASAAALSLAPEECMMVAAHNDDLAAARACGLRTGFVSRPAEHGAGQTTDLAPESDWDVIADDFLDLADKLGT